MSDGAFPRDRHLTSIAIAYSNPAASYIADKVLPRVTIGKKRFTYYEYPLETSFQTPDTKVGERSQVPVIHLNGTEREDKATDHGIGIPLTADDIKEAAPGTDPRDRATERSMDIVLRDREIEVANLCFSAGSYPASQKVDVSGGTQWDQDSADPLKYIAEKLEECVMRPNVIAFGAQTWLKVSMHPKVVKAANGNDGGNGRCTRERFAELLEIEEVVVGASRYNSVKPGKTPVLARAWGKHALAFYRDATVDTTGGITFGYTACFGKPEAGYKEIDMGVRGGTLVRAWETRKDLIVAPYASFFFENAVP